MKKINITSAVLIIYLVIMSVMGWPGRNPHNTYTEYFCIIGVTLFVICLLRYLQIRRMKIRDAWKKDK